MNRVVEHTGARFVSSAESPVYADFKQVIVDLRGRLNRAAIAYAEPGHSRIRQH